MTDDRPDHPPDLQTIIEQQQEQIDDLTRAIQAHQIALGALTRAIQALEGRDQTETG